MGVYQRAAVLTALGFLAATVMVAGLPHSPSGSTAALAAAAATTVPCVPNQPAPGILPTPPTIDTAKQPTFTLYVKQGANAQTGQSYCYVTTPGGTTSYVEAPTIRVRQGATFTMTLINQIPYTGPSPIPTPANPVIPTDDGCAWLPDDGAMPTPYPQMTPPGYFNHPRVPVHAMPPWMLDNDTNFHTHGWHVSPYVDNVYKSMAWAPTPNTCVFKFTVRTSQPPGTYWYHAHLHGLSDSQVGGGLAGALIVDPLVPSPEASPILLVIKNSSVNQKPASGALMKNAAMSATMPQMGRPDRLHHYAAIDAQTPHKATLRATAPAPAAAFSAFSPPPWNSGIPWPKTPKSYCEPQPTVDNVDSLAVNGALIPVVLGGVTTPAVGPRVNQIGNTLRRYRIVNAASDAYVNIQTVYDDSTVVPLSVVGRDGVPVNWNLETEKIDPTKPASIVVPNVYVPPSGRVDIMVRAGRPLTIISAAGSPAVHSADGTPFCNGYFGSPVPRRNILRVMPLFAANQPRMLAVAPPVQQHTAKTAAALLVEHDLPRVTKSRAITFTMYPENNWNWNVTQTGVFNGRNPPPSVKSLPFTERPFWLAQGKTPVDPHFPYVPWVQVRQNDVEEWYLYNATGEIHAFHIHQLSFVAEYSPFEATNPYQQVFLDTIALPAGMLTNQQVVPAPGTTPLITPSMTKILIDFRNVDPGVFVFHCHMLFHEDHGMMGIVEVLPALPKK
jgi:FtsP/CotA-like multicopper oxidase with cupredoxin domain